MEEPPDPRKPPGELVIDAVEPGAVLAGHGIL
jgi:hypothetical protein